MKRVILLIAMLLGAGMASAQKEIGAGYGNGALGSTQGNVLIQANDFSASTIAHELGHTFGLLDNYPNNCGGLMDYPAGALSPKDVDLIIKYAYVKKK